MEFTSRLFAEFLEEEGTIIKNVSSYIIPEVEFAFLLISFYS